MTYQAEVQADSPVDWWRFYDRSGGCSPNPAGSSGSYADCMACAAPCTGGSYLDRQTGFLIQEQGYAALAQGAHLTPGFYGPLPHPPPALTQVLGRKATFEAWIKVDLSRLPLASGDSACDGDGDLAGADRYAVMMLRGDLGIGCPAVQVKIHDDGHVKVHYSTGTHSSTSATGVIQSNTWHHLVLVIDTVTGGIDPSNGYKLYVDGVERINTSNVPGFEVVYVSGATEVALHYGTPGYSISNGNQFNDLTVTASFWGSIAEVAIYNAALSVARIRAHYAAATSWQGSDSTTASDAAAVQQELSRSASDALTASESAYQTQEVSTSDSTAVGESIVADAGPLVQDGVAVGDAVAEATDRPAAASDSVILSEQAARPMSATDSQIIWESISGVREFSRSTSDSLMTSDSSVVDDNSRSASDSIVISEQVQRPSSASDQVSIAEAAAQPQEVVDGVSISEASTASLDTRGALDDLVAIEAAAANVVFQASASEAMNVFEGAVGYRVVLASDSFSVSELLLHVFPESISEAEAVVEAATGSVEHPAIDGVSVGENVALQQVLIRAASDSEDIEEVAICGRARRC